MYTIRQLSVRLPATAVHGVQQQSTRQWMPFRYTPHSFVCDFTRIYNDILSYSMEISKNKQMTNAKC